MLWWRNALAYWQGEAGDPATRASLARCRPVRVRDVQTCPVPGKAPHLGALDAEPVASLGDSGQQLLGRRPQREHIKSREARLAHAVLPLPQRDLEPAVPVEQRDPADLALLDVLRHKVEIK
jgi:hypothetical protein